MNGSTSSPAKQLTVFNTGPNAVTQNFNPGDIGYVKRAQGHYIRNTGNTDLLYLEVFRSSYFSDVSLSDWLAPHATRAGGPALQHRLGDRCSLPAR